MNDVERHKYAGLMAEIERLEDALAVMEKDAGADDGGSLAQEMREIQEQLAVKRAELARISDGCGRPHPMA